MADPDRNGGGGLSLRTLVIASAASLTAAVVSSRLFPPGTIYASAMTPVIVAAVSELLNRPANRVSELRRQRRTLVYEAARAPHGEEAAALRGAPEFAQGSAADEELAVHGNGTGDPPPIRIHGTRSRLLHPKVWLVTGLVAFAIAAAVLTLPELIFGGALGSQHRTTYFGGGSSSTKTNTTTTDTTTTGTTKTTTQQQKTVTETVPSQTPTTTATTPTATQPTTTDTSTTPAPSGGTAPQTNTSTQPAPSGAATPTP